MGRWSGWYRTTYWKAKRKRQLQEHPLCKICMDSGRVVAATVVDHIDPHRGDWEKFQHGELQSLCHPCHVGIKQSIETRMGMRSIGEDGWPV